MLISICIACANSKNVPIQSDNKSDRAEAAVRSKSVLVRLSCRGFALYRTLLHALEHLLCILATYYLGSIL